MGFSDRLRGRKNDNSKPHIAGVQPSAALPGGEVRITGNDLRPADLRRPLVRFGEVEGSVVISSDDFVVARVPYGASSGPIVVSTNGHSSNPHQIKVAVPIAENLHPVSNPALDSEGNIFVTFSGSRGQKVPVSIFKIDTTYNTKPFLADLMNATSIAFDRAGQMYVSSRYDGTVYRVAPNATMTSYAEGMGVATGIAFDRGGNLYVGDRSGTIFKIAPDRQIFVFATLEPSVSAYHLTFGCPGQRFHVLPGIGTSAGHGVRCRRQSLCGRFTLRQTWYCEDRPQRPGFPGGRRCGPRGPRLRSRTLCNSGDHQCPSPPCLEHSRAAVDRARLR